MDKEASLKVDLAPGKSHIALRVGEKCYYVPALLHMAPTFSRVCPLFINDVLNSKSMVNIYGTSGLSLHHSQYFLINNHPIKRVSLSGKILSYFFKEVDQSKPSDRNYYIFTIDDCSSHNSLIIQVKAKQSICAGLNLPPMDSCYGTIINAIGLIKRVYDFEPQLDCFHLSILGKPNDFDVELDQWMERLEFRKRMLEKPWKYQPPELSSDHELTQDPPMLRKDYQRKLNRQQLQLSESLPNAGLVPLHKDSVIIHHDRIRAQRPIICLDPEVEIVHCSTRPTGTHTPETPLPIPLASKGLASFNNCPSSLPPSTLQYPLKNRTHDTIFKTKEKKELNRSSNALLESFKVDKPQYTSTTSSKKSRPKLVRLQQDPSHNESTSGKKTEEIPRDDAFTLSKIDSSTLRGKRIVNKAQLEIEKVGRPFSRK